MGGHCHKCGKYGHFASTCWSKGRDFAVWGGGGGRGGGEKRKRAGGGWEGMKVPELKAACKDRNLVATGRKADLVRRLDEYLRDKSDAAGGAKKEGGTSSRSRPPAPAPAARAGGPWSEENDIELWSLRDGPTSDLARARRIVGGGGKAKVTTAAVCLPVHNLVDGNGPHRLDGSASLDMAAARSSGIAFEELGRRELEQAQARRKEVARLGDSSDVGGGVFVISPNPSSSDVDAGSPNVDVGDRRASFEESAASNADKSNITSEQLERMERNREEARRKKMTRLSTSSDVGGGFVVISQSPSSSNAGSLNVDASDRRAKSAGGWGGMAPPPPPPSSQVKAKVQPVSNPYLQKPSALVKRDKSRPENAFFDVPGQRPVRTLADLPPLPPDCPAVREETRRILNEQQIEVIMAARPPSPSPPSAAADSAGEGDVDGVPSYSRTKGAGGDAGAPHCHHHMVRVNAAAGTGKTLSLVHLAIRCIDLKHESVQYVTFSKAAANDARDRMRAELDEQGLGDRVHASTMHSIAMQLLSDEPPDEQDHHDKSVLNDIQLKKVIQENWGHRIDDYLKKAIEHVKLTTSDKDDLKLERKVRLLREKALHYLFKTLENFTQNSMSLEALKDTNSWSRHYYPVKLGFKEGGEAAKLGFPPSVYSFKSSYTFYADLCVEIWEDLVRNGIRTFNVEMKKAQLQKLRIPCSALLVDECQDLDGCQVSWIEGQKEFGTHIFFVGDSAQCIYGFRGAKSSYVMKLDCIDIMLTKSWRFGRNIAKVANIALIAKEKSPQTTGRSETNRLWLPYRVQGARRAEEEKESSNPTGGGVVTTKSLLLDWKLYNQVTLIGFTNGNLMRKAMGLLGLSGLEVEESCCEDVESLDIDRHEVKINKVPINADYLPKIHINGEGDMSGMKKWRKDVKKIRSLYDLYTHRDESGFLPLTLPPADFKDFVDIGPVTWDSFNKHCVVKEITTYICAVSIISTYKRNTLQAIDAFECHVLAKNISAEDADIILTTAHSAKGLEWDHVEICDDILDLSAKSVAESLPATVCHPSFLMKMPSEVKSEEYPFLKTSTGNNRKGWQFALSPFQDVCINLLYVALTRARTTLSVPSSMTKLLEEFDMLHYLVGTYIRDASGVDGRKVPLSADGPVMMMGKNMLTKGDVWNLNQDLCVPLRNELEIADTMMIIPSLFADRVGENLEIKFEEEHRKQALLSVAVQPDVFQGAVDPLIFGGAVDMFGNEVAKCFDC